MPIHIPKVGFWDLTLQMGSSIIETYKQYTLHDSVSFDPSGVNIRQEVWPVVELPEKG